MRWRAGDGLPLLARCFELRLRPPFFEARLLPAFCTLALGLRLRLSFALWLRLLGLRLLLVGGLRLRLGLRLLLLDGLVEEGEAET